jgi:integrase
LKKRGISAQTFNFYIQAIKQFCRWMVKDRRTTESPVVHLDGLNVKTDRRHDRRALTVKELIKLLDATLSGPNRLGMNGPERSMLYRLAVETGLRAGELRSLTRASFELEGNNPAVTVEAEYSKRRRKDTQPLRPGLATDLKGFLATLIPAAPAFPSMPCRFHLAKMFRADLKAAGITYRDDAGLVADFHSLRHTFISNLARGGVPSQGGAILGQAFDHYSDDGPLRAYARR